MQVMDDGSVKLLSRREVLTALRTNPDAEIYHRCGKRLVLNPDRRLALESGEIVTESEVPVYHPDAEEAPDGEEEA